MGKEKLLQGKCQFEWKHLKTIEKHLKESRQFLLVIGLCFPFISIFSSIHFY